MADSSHFVKYDASCHSGTPSSSKMRAVGQPMDRMHTSQFTQTFANINKQMNSDMAAIKKNKQHMSY